MALDGLRGSNASIARGIYSPPVLPTTGRLGSVDAVIKPETWDEVLQHLKTLLDDNARLNQALHENNDRVERVIKLKDDTIELAQKRHWDVRISVLGFKSRILSLEHEIEQRKKEPSSSDEGSSVSSEKIEELKRTIEHLKNSKHSVVDNATELSSELNSTKDELTRLESKLQQEVHNNNHIKKDLEHQVLKLQDDLKRKSSSPPQPKPRTNIQTKQDGKISQLEREKDEIKGQLKSLQEKHHEEKVSRNEAEQKWSTLNSDYEAQKYELEEFKRAVENMQSTKSHFKKQITAQETKIKRLEKDNKELQNKSPSTAAKIGTPVGGGGSLGMRKQLNDAIQKNNELQNKVRELEEELSTVSESYADYKESFNIDNAESSKLRERIRNKESEVKKLRDELSDLEHGLKQEIVTVENKNSQLTGQLQEYTERYHALQMEYSKAMSTIMNHKKKSENESEEMAQNWNEVEQQMIGLMSSVEEKQKQIQELTRDLHGSEQLRANAEDNRDRMMEKLKQKQQDCENYLSQMEIWRAQYETAQSDFNQERAVREKEASVVLKLKENRNELQREVGELRKRVTDQRAIINNMQATSSYVPESYTREINTSVTRRPTEARRYTDVQYNEKGMVTGMGTGMIPGTGMGTGMVPGTGMGMGMGMVTGVGMVTGGGNYRPPTTLSHEMGGGPMYNRKDDFGMGQEFSTKPPVATASNIPEPLFGQEPMNQLDNPGPHPPQHSSQPVNAFPQFPMGANKREMNAVDMPGNLNKMGAPIVESCPICGRNGFKTQTDLEVHAAKCTF